MNIKDFDNRLLAFSQEHGAVLLGMHAELLEFKGAYHRQIDEALASLSSRIDVAVGVRQQQLVQTFATLKQQVDRQLEILTNSQKKYQLQLETKVDEFDATQKRVREFIGVQQNVLNEHAANLQRAHEQVVEGLLDLKSRNAQYQASITRFIRSATRVGVAIVVCAVAAATYFAVRT